MKRIIDLVKNNRLINNFVVLLTGEGIVSILSMLSFSIIIASIGNEGNGMIISIQTYCILLNGIFGFKSFQALIKYIVYEIENNNKEKIKEYIFQSYALDLAAVGLATVFSFVFLNFYGDLMNWNQTMRNLTIIYIVASAFQIQGTPIGILRVYNKFNLITYNNTIVAGARFLLYVVGFFAKYNIYYYFGVEVILVLVQNIMLNILCFTTLKQYDLNDFYKCKLKFDKEFFKFNIYTNIASTIDIPVGTLTSTIINGYLGYADLSVYKAFEKIGALLGKLSSPLSQIIYPELNNYIVKGDIKKAKKMSDRLFYGINAIGIVMIIGTLLTYKWWLGFLIDGYQAFIIPLIVYLIYTSVTNAAVGVHNLFLALNYVKYIVPIVICVNIVYLGVIYVLIIKWKLMGVIISLFLQAIAVILIKIAIMKRNDYKELV
ncbi:lipopolysaccharide biosynthesis protein [Clostridium chrysemydis]|uniref:lipopolysaccharide biosynthesis protein n=1 Tax=Clostridium chrysemydis TaxID=2665504 RepID=UPI003F3051DF